MKTFLTGISFEALLTILGVLAAFGLGIREMFERRKTKAKAAAQPANAERLQALDGLRLMVKDVRLSAVAEDSGAQQLTFSVVLGSEMSDAEAMEAGRGRFPKNVTVVNVTEQPFGVVQPGVRRAAQTAGDEDAGFHRFALKGWPAGASVETYRWGRLAASVAVRLMWLLLLPFQLGNVTLWLCPARRGFRRGLMQLLCRVLALTLTVSLVLALAGIALDLAGWQCVFRDQACDGVGSVFPDWMNGPQHLGRRLAAMSLLPIAVVCFVWYLANLTWRDYEQHPDPAWPRTDGGSQSELGSPAFWETRHTVRRLRALHIAAGFATINLVLLGALSQMRSTQEGLTLLFSCAAVLACCVSGLALPWVVQHTQNGGADTFVTLLRVLSIALTLLTLRYSATADLASARSWQGTALPLYRQEVTWLFVVQLLIGLSLLALAVTRRPKHWRVADLGSPVVASLALGAAVTVESIVIYRMADLLSGQKVTAKLSEPGSFPALPYQWAGVGFAVMLGLATLAGLILVRPNQTELNLSRQRTDDMFDGKRVLGPRRAARIDRATARSDIVRRVVGLLILASIPIAVLAIVGAVNALRNYPPSPFLGQSWFTAGSGPYVIVAALLVLFVLVVLTAANRRVRTVFGFLWELGTFWPRSCHPLAPPCYASRTVPELVVRINELATAKPEAAVVVVGYGQGSLLAVAALLQLPDEARQRVALVTAGSPVGLLYKRIFGQHFNDELFGELAAALSTAAAPPRWVNLHRHTDPVSGPIGSAAVDKLLCDPVVFEIPADKGRYLPIHGHNRYEEDPEFAATIRALATRMM
ncbi:hypothetical protein Rhe02_18270 [Rhizocola hellebori]|uniref:Uncharacterized protein n=1 Tax=Rhizocola hellebori TaxID=1392758 RepID=A0A8J3VEQ8_9ACTN|nr:hypothetical protein [Rhizocola hellebori]GIH03760.1 hypothetical protein Rhe02_18270 [Rhizocola hellebori]